MSPTLEEPDYLKEPAPSARSAASARPPATPFIKVLLRKTPIMVLFERRSMTALADTEEGRLVMEDNRKYDELLSGTDKTRRTVDADTQTMTALMKSRLVNTERLTTAQMGSYVSNFEMYRATYNAYGHVKKRMQDRDKQRGFYGFPGCGHN